MGHKCKGPPCSSCAIESRQERDRTGQDEAERLSWNMAREEIGEPPPTGALDLIRWQARVERRARELYASCLETVRRKTSRVARMASAASGLNRS